VIAYVFWHWRNKDVDPPEYERRQRAFHSALKRSPPEGFLTSFSMGLSGASWAADGGPAYEDWYLVSDFSALGALNDGAVSGSRLAPHQEAVTAAQGGTAGLYALRDGAFLPSPAVAVWFSKPPGVAYADLLGRLHPLVQEEKCALWIRQMTLGPAREFCLHASRNVSLPLPFEWLPLALRPVWPQE